MLSRTFNQIVTKTSSSNIQLDALDGLRGIAVLFVVVAHSSYTGFTPGINFQGAGTIGVYLFFVLSSFLLTLPFIIKNYDLRKKNIWINYSLRRIFRIYPLYLVIIILFFSISSLGALNKDASLFLTTSDFINHLLILDGKAYLWTIQVETKFYLILPIIIFVLLGTFKNKLLYVVPFIISLMLIISFFTVDSIHIKSFIVQLPVFLSGCLAALIYCHIMLSDKKYILEKYRLRSILNLTAITLLLITIFIIPDISQTIFNNNQISKLIELPIFFGLLWSSCLLSLPFLRFVGIISFSIYIWHIPVLSVLKRLHIADGWVNFLLTITMVIILATCSYLWIERPFLKIKFNY